jgi:hypothetical protein
MASNGVVISDDKFEIMWMKLITFCVMELTWNSAGEIEQNHEKPLEKNSVPA